MRQIWISRSGAPEVLLPKLAPDPTPRGNQILIESKAIGVNFADVLARAGRYPDAPALPFVPGFEVAGVVHQVGDRVTQFRKGDRVIAAPTFGGYSDRLCVSEELALPLPPEMDFATATAFPVQYATAYQLVFETARVRSTDTVFIHAAAGGVGTALIDLCRVQGAKIIGAAGAEKHGWLRDRGVALVLDSRSEHFWEDLRQVAEQHALDIVFDSVGGNSWRTTLEILAPLGRLCLFGNSSVLREDGGTVAANSKLFGGSGWFQFDAFELVARNKGILGVNLATLRKEIAPALYRTWMEKLFELWRAGTVRPEIGKVFKLDEAAAAHRFLQSRLSRGKIVLEP